MSHTGPGDMVQVHLLTAYPASLLNRDDAGLAKRLPFGGTVRTRISSQCLKKHWREAPLVAELGTLAVRSRRIYDDLVAVPLQADHGATAAEAAAIARYLLDHTLTSKGGDEGAKDADPGGEPAKSIETGQVVVLTRAETEFLLQKAADILAAARAQGVDLTAKKPFEKLNVFPKEELAQLRKLLSALPASLDTALFGRMVTSDLFARVDAAVGVAHAFTTHAEEAETDYFTAVDTLKDVDESADAGAGLIQDSELTTGVFYTYAVLDMAQLRANLVGCDDALAERLARHLVQAMATVSPGAKRGATAPYAYAELVLLERGGDQPRTLANAFLSAVAAPGDDLMVESARRLLDYRDRLARMYGPPAGDAVLSTIHNVEPGDLPVMCLAEALESVFVG